MTHRREGARSPRRIGPRHRAARRGVPRARRRHAGPRGRRRPGAGVGPPAPELHDRPPGRAVAPPARVSTKSTPRRSRRPWTTCSRIAGRDSRARKCRRPRRRSGRNMPRGRAGQAAENLAAGEAFFASNSKNEGIEQTPDGVQYRVLRAGEGTTPSAEDRVVVHYRGRLLDGTEFDSSYRRGEPTEFMLGAVIPGWQAALQLMPVGGALGGVDPGRACLRRAGRRRLDRSEPGTALRDRAHRDQAERLSRVPDLAGRAKLHVGPALDGETGADHRRREGCTSRSSSSRSSRKAEPSSRQAEPDLRPRGSRGTPRRASARWRDRG